MNFSDVLQWFLFFVPALLWVLGLSFLLVLMLWWTTNRYQTLTDSQLPQTIFFLEGEGCPEIALPSDFETPPEAPLSPDGD